MIMISSYEKLAGLNNIFGIWHVNNYLRVTFVSQGWLVVWDHRSHPPLRHDCKGQDHRDTCALAESKLRELIA